MKKILKIILFPYVYFFIQFVRIVGEIFEDITEKGWRINKDVVELPINCWTRVLSDEEIEKVFNNTN
jgi:hypothetical protein